MSSNQNYQFFPAVSCWIKHLQQAKFNPQDKSFFTIFGSLKRVKIVATIIEKEEFVSKRASDEDNLTEDININFRFILDDGTGIIYAIKWFSHNVPAKSQQFADLYKSLERGDRVNLFGKINSWNDKIQISIENLNKLDNPNYTLFHDAKIVRKIKNDALYEIPTDFKDINSDKENSDAEEEFTFNSISDNIDIDNLFTNSKGPEINKQKERVYTIIEEYSQNGNGITFNELKIKLNFGEEKLRRHLEDLVMESRIYESEENLYQCF